MTSITPSDVNTLSAVQTVRAIFLAFSSSPHSVCASLPPSCAFLFLCFLSLFCLPNGINTIDNCNGIDTFNAKQHVCTHQGTSNQMDNERDCWAKDAELAAKIY